MQNVSTRSSCVSQNNSICGRFQKKKSEERDGEERQRGRFVLKKIICAEIFCLLPQVQQ